MVDEKKDKLVITKVDEDLINKPPWEREFILIQDGDVKPKVTLSFTFDSRRFPGCVLDNVKPIMINDEPIEIEPPLPLEYNSPELKYIQRPDLVVTDYVHMNSKGRVNKIRVNYRSIKPSLFNLYKKRVVAHLKMTITNHGSATITQTTTQTNKFCMWHGEPIPGSAFRCPHIDSDPFPTLTTAETTKKCRLCSHEIHILSKYCPNDGSQQPSE